MIGAAAQRAAATAVVAIVAACASLRSPPPVAVTSTERVMRCIPREQRAGAEFGCFLVASQPVGRLGATPAFWYVDRFATRSGADAARGPRGIVVESFGSVWLLSVDSAGLQSAGSERAARIGPLPVDPRVDYTAQFMEAVFRPGMKTLVHRHPGPEAWYTISGQTCLETPKGTLVGRAGGPPVIVPGGPPMELTATGTETRRALVLILHDASQAMSMPATDWTATGACTR